MTARQSGPRLRQAIARTIVIRGWRIVWFLAHVWRRLLFRTTFVEITGRLREDDCEGMRGGLPRHQVPDGAHLHRQLSTHMPTAKQPNIIVIWGDAIGMCLHPRHDGATLRTSTGVGREGMVG